MTTQSLPSLYAVIDHGIRVIDHGIALDHNRRLLGSREPFQNCGGLLWSHKSFAPDDNIAEANGVAQAAIKRQTRA